MTGILSRKASGRCFAPSRTSAARTGRCGVSPAEGVAENACLWRLETGEDFPLLKLPCWRTSQNLSAIIRADERFNLTSSRIRSRAVRDKRLAMNYLHSFLQAFSQNSKRQAFLGL